MGCKSDERQLPSLQSVSVYVEVIGAPKMSPKLNNTALLSALRIEWAAQCLHAPQLQLIVLACSRHRALHTGRVHLLLMRC